MKLYIYRPSHEYQLPVGLQNYLDRKLKPDTSSLANADVFLMCVDTSKTNIDNDEGLEKVRRMAHLSNQVQSKHPTIPRILFISNSSNKEMCELMERRSSFQFDHIFYPDSDGLTLMLNGIDLRNKTYQSFEKSNEITQLRLAIEKLRDYKGDNSKRLGDELKADLEQFIRQSKIMGKAPSYEQFKKDFKKKLHRNDEDFARHTNYKKIIVANVLLALTLIGPLVKMIHSHFTTGKNDAFFNKTRTQTIVEEIDYSLNKPKVP